MLSYFGEALPATADGSPWRCGNCDNCEKPPATFDATEPVRKLLSACYRTGQKFGAMHLIDVLRGESNDKVTRFGHDKLSVFGIGKELDDRSWRNLIRQCIAADLLSVDHEQFGSLHLTQAAKPVLRGERMLAFRESVVAPAAGGRRKRSKKASDGALSAGKSLASLSVTEALFERLKTWRANEARTRNVPAYVIFHDATLRAIADHEPQDLDTLSELPGVGAKKLTEFGDAILAIVTVSR